MDSREETTSHSELYVREAKQNHEKTCDRAPLSIEIVREECHWLL